MRERLNPFDCGGESVSRAEKFETTVFLARWIIPILAMGGGALIGNRDISNYGSLATVANGLYDAGGVIVPRLVDRFHR
jgi:hypothetical protein